MPALEDLFAPEPGFDGPPAPFDFGLAQTPGPKHPATAQPEEAFSTGTLPAPAVLAQLVMEQYSSTERYQLLCSLLRPADLAETALPDLGEEEEASPAPKPSDGDTGWVQPPPPHPNPSWANRVLEGEGCIWVPCPPDRPMPPADTLPDKAWSITDAGACLGLSRKAAHNAITRARKSMEPGITIRLLAADRSRYLERLPGLAAWELRLDPLTTTGATDDEDSRPDRLGRRSARDSHR